MVVDAQGGSGSEPRPGDVGDDRNDPEDADEIASRHHVRHPDADPIIRGRPRAPITGWLWISALAAVIAVLAVAAIASRSLG